MGNSNDNLYSLENFKQVYPTDSKSNQSIIRQSGNSDVDVSVEVDTTPIAYAMLCSLLATKQLSNKEFEAAVRKLEELTNKKESHSINNKNDTSKAKLYDDRRRRRY